MCPRFSGPAGPVSVAIDGVANDGEVGELDDVDIDVENLTRSPFADVLTGSSSANTFDGGLGADTIAGLAGVDKLDSGNGNDTFHARDKVKDPINGGNGTDSAQTDKSDVKTSVEKVTK